MFRRPLVTLLFFVGVAAALPHPIQAQYFGRNQVQYDKFDFEVLQTEHFDIYFYGEEKEAAELAGVMAERWYTRLSRLLNHQLRDRQAVIYYASHPDFQQTNALGGAPGESTGGATEIFKRRVVLPFAGPLRETDHVLGHELVHAFQFDMTGQGRTRSENTVPVAITLPLWFIEGMAEYLSIGPNDAHTAMWIRDAKANNRLPTIRQLYDPRYFPYRFGQAFWAYISGRWGDEVVGRILNAAARAGSAEAAIQMVLRIPIDSLVSDWHDAIGATYDPVGERSFPATEYGARVLSELNSGSMNMAPALSPNGQQIVFLSEKDLFAIEMFRANLETGQVEKKIVETATDPHHESLQFINSAGVWSPDGQIFAFGAIVKGEPVLSLVNATTGARVREIEISEVGEIFNPSWSPDGRYVVFSAIAGGLSDLFMYDLEADSLIRLTDDLYADLHPTWSPDGSQIAFVSDRFSTNVANLDFGNYRLTMIDPVTREIRPVPSFVKGKNINPQWTRDSQSLYFLANPDGVTNLYRIELATASVFRVTSLYTGISGITGLSPALSSASDVDKIAFSVYEDGNYNVYTIDDLDQLRGEPVNIEMTQDGTPTFALRNEDDTGLAFDAGVLPPNNRDPGDIESYLSDPTFGLTDQNSFGVEPYKPRLSLDFISQPYLAAGSDRYGTFIGGGASAYWSDMLGRHNLLTQFQFQGSFTDVAAVVGYLNRRSRWNWGFTVGQVPLITQQFGLSQGIIGGELVLQESRQLLKQYNRDLQGFVSYPFSRVTRIEFAGGIRNISFSRELRRFTFSQIDGAELQDEKIDLPSPRALNLATSSVALVHDNSFFGATSPILGQRYRLEAAPSFGSLNYVFATADFRKYFMPVRPFTFAFRALHFGRYGSDAENGILSDLFIGFPSTVRGYDFNSIDVNECGTAIATSVTGCPLLDQMFGSKVVVANAELRFPLFGALGIGQGMFGVLPVDFVAFADAGLAWSEDHTNVQALGLEFGGSCGPGGCRKPIYSMGAGLRFNLLGFLIMELDYVKPFQRPLKGAHWQFHFTPGF